MTPYTNPTDATAAVLTSRMHYQAKRRLLERARIAATAAVRHIADPTTRRDIHDTAYIATITAALTKAA